MIAYLMAGIGYAEPTNSATNAHANQPHVVTANELPSWWERVKKIEMGTTRAQVEAVLPTNTASEVVSAGAVAGGRGSWDYYFSDDWIVTIGYEVPMGTKDGIRKWDYGSPNARVIETPKISRRNIK